MHSLLKISHPCITVRLLCHFPRFLKWRYATWISFTHNCWGIVVSSWKFSFFFYHVSLVYRREKTWRSDDSTLSFDQIFTDILFSFCFWCLNYSFHHPQKCITAIHDSADSFWHITSNIEHIHSLYWRFPDHTFW